MNAGSYGGEVSQYEIAEVLIFDRTLSGAEIANVERYIGFTYGISGLDSALQFPYTHGQTADFTVQAQWTANSNTVTYDAQGGSSVASVTWTTGSTLTLPAAPTRTGYSFGGWYDAPTGGTKVGGASATYSPSNTANFTLLSRIHI